MATGCRRLALLLSRNWAPRGCKLHRRALAASVYAPSEGHTNRVPALTRLPLANGGQHYSTKVVDSSEEVVEEPPGIFKRFWRWLHSDEGDVEYQMSEEEREERDQVMLKIQEMYFANPPIEPDLEFYKEVIRMLIKYNDRLGVDTLWNLMVEMKIEPDEELTSTVLPYLKEARENA